MKFTPIIFMVFCANILVAQISDLNLHVSALIKNELDYRSDSLKRYRYNEFKMAALKMPLKSVELTDTSDNFLKPLILLNGSTISLDELNYWSLHKVDSIRVIKKPEASKVFGSEALNGAILVFIKPGALQILIDRKNYPITFETSDGTKISIHGDIKEKYFWKELILSDNYFVDQLLVTKKGYKRCVDIADCSISNEYQSQKTIGYVMKITLSYAPISGPVGIGFRSLCSYLIEINKAKTYFFKVLPDSGCEI